MAVDSIPSLALTADFATAGSTDITQYIRDASITIDRGTGSPSMTGLVADAGQMNLTLSNTVRQFDPTFTTGPFFGDLIPGVPMALVAMWDSTAYPLFAGVNVQWPQVYPNSRTDQITQIQCADAIRGLARAQLVKVFPRQLSGVRIEAVTNALGYTGSVFNQNGTAYVPFFGDGQSATAAWSLMTDAANAEWGALFVDAAGDLFFLDRPAIAGTAEWSTPQATFGDAPGELKFSDVTIAFDDERIVNDADLLYNQFGSKAHAEDLTSQAKYAGTGSGVYSWQQNFQLSSGMLARSFVHEVVRRYADATLRIDQLIVKPRRDPANLWPVVLGLELGQQIAVNLTPMGGGARIEQVCYIRHITHTYGNQDWTVTYDVDDSSLVTVNSFYDDGHLYDDGTLYSF